ncbi:MAG: hypothetical protein R3B93_21000 [Bacteroidia bacterium]
MEKDDPLPERPPDERKSIFWAIVLPLVFGPAGLLYSSDVGFLIMAVIHPALGLMTHGVSLLVLWPVSVIWSACAAWWYNHHPDMT